MGEDWFHYGAFRQVNLDYFTEQTSETGKGESVPRWGATAEEPGSIDRAASKLLVEGDRYPEHLEKMTRL